MEKFYFELPSMERKEEAIQYINEFHDYKSEINGTGSLNRYIDDYEGWLKKIEEDLIRESSEDRVPASTYFTIRESDNKIIGMINLRHCLNKALDEYGGHIGYGIRPTERRKGYAKIQLYLCLLEAKKLKIDRVRIDCIDTNIGSEKTMQALGGIYEGSTYIKEKNKTLKKYWINVDDSIEKYEDEYKKYILNNKK